MSENILPFPKPVDGAVHGPSAPPSNVLKIALIPMNQTAIGPSPATPGKIIPFPAEEANPSSVSKIIAVSFTRVDGAGGKDPAPTPTELPGAPFDSEENALRPGSATHQAGRRRVGHCERKRPAHRVQASVHAESTDPVSFRGTSSAELQDCMDSTARPERMQRLNGSDESSLEDRPSQGKPFLTAGSERNDASASEQAATEWQGGRAFRRIDQSASGIFPKPASASSTPAEQIFYLLLRETLLARQYGSDTMTVALRPDGDTELVLHLTQSNGRLEATVRCERGDLPQLRALWAQVQETMALQRVHLGPLEEPIGSDGPGDSEFCEGDGTPVQAAASGDAPENDSLDEWPSPASSVSASPHIRGRRGSRIRRTTSRPGWETWA
jgi:hypothetical protein